jgi:hypothetical protein
MSQCDGVSKKRPRARPQHQTPSGEASVKGFQETVRFALGEAVSSIPQRNLIPDAISGSIDSSKSSKRGGSNATLSETLQKGGRKPSHYSGYVCPTEVPYCEDEKTVDWASFVAFAQRKSNSFARSRMTQMIGITVPGELDGIKLPLTDGANVNKAEKMVRFSYESDRRWLEPAYNAAGDPAMEARVLLPFLKKAKNALEETIDAVIITDDAGTYGVSLAVVAKRFSVPPPRAYDLIYEVRKDLSCVICFVCEYVDALKGSDATFSSTHSALSSFSCSLLFRQKNAASSSRRFHRQCAHKLSPS